MIFCFWVSFFIWFFVVFLTFVWDFYFFVTSPQGPGPWLAAAPMPFAKPWPLWLRSFAFVRMLKLLGFTRISVRTEQTLLLYFHQTNVFCAGSFRLCLFPLMHYGCLVSFFFYLACLITWFRSGFVPSLCSADLCLILQIVAWAYR